MKIHYFQHVPFEGLGLIVNWASARGHSLSATRFYDSDKIPAMNYDALIIMGGPMSVHDSSVYPWLMEEKAHIKNAIKADKPILGVCLGAQLIADVLGAEIAQAPAKEIGWFPIAWSDAAMGSPLLAGINSAMNVFHWHGEQFSIPEGATRLASSKACANQAFLYRKNVLGLQFHLEMDEDAINNLIENCGDELKTNSPAIQLPETIRGKTANIPSCQRALFTMLDNWLWQANY